MSSRLTTTLGSHKPSSRRVDTLRNLTLGVLIVSVGTLAALPFRRSSSNRENLDAAVRATGPTNTPLDFRTGEVTFNPATEVRASTIGSPAWMPQNITEPMHGERFIHMPESYSTEASELPRPKVVAERYSASVDYQSEATVQRQQADHASVMSGDLARAQLATEPSQLSDLAQGAGQNNPAAQFAGSGLYPSQGVSVHKPLAGDARSAPVAMSGNRFSGMEVGAADVAGSMRPLGSNHISQSQPREEVVSRDTFVSSRAARPASESLGAAPASDPAPPLPPAQAERLKHWIRQPN